MSKIDNFALQFRILNIKGLTKFLAIFKVYLKFFMHIEDYTNEFPKFQVHKLCGSWNVYIQKCVIFFAERFAISTFQTFYLASDVVLAFDWPVTICHCNCERQIGQSVDDWQVVVNSSPSQRVHSVIGQLRALSLAWLLKSSFRLKCESINP